MNGGVVASWNALAHKVLGSKHVKQCFGGAWKKRDIQGKVKAMVGKGRRENGKATLMNCRCLASCRHARLFTRQTG